MSAPSELQYNQGDYATVTYRGLIFMFSYVKIKVIDGKNTIYLCGGAW